MATANPFRFSTKFQDDETGLLYYGYRYYNSSTGRWMSNDPVQESGGNNLYAFVGNDPNGKVDVLGQWILPLPPRIQRTRIRINLPIIAPPIIPPVVAYGCFTCGGKFFNRSTHCCCDGKLIQRGPQTTAVRICGSWGTVIPIAWHQWIELGSDSIDVVASESIYGSPGLISVPSTYAGGGTCKSVALDGCKYDPDKFEGYVQSFIDYYESKMDPSTRTYTENSWPYYVIGHNCWSFVDEIVGAAKAASRRKNCGADITALTDYILRAL